MMKNVFVLFAALWGAACAGEVASIRYCASAPFDAKGNRVETQWKTADSCVRFVTVRTSDVAVDQSEAQLLFDEKNLYVSLKGYYDSKYEFGDVAKSIGAGNNFDFQIKIGDGAIFQVIVDEFARAKFSKNRVQVLDGGAKVAVEKKKGCWTANITIPLSAMDITAPEGETAAKVAIFRQNINVHERQIFKYISKRCEVSGYTPNEYNFSVVDNWADMKLTRKVDKARRVAGPSLGRQINLYPNSDFNIPGRCWHACGKTAYQETMAMSGEWIYRSSGKDYQVLMSKPFGVKPDTRYTLVVKARSFGSGSGLRVVQMARNKAGKLYEGRRVTTLTPVGPEMHEYYIPFTSSADDLWTIVFYKVDAKTDDTGIDFASIRLYEGEISSFEIRQIVRPGRMAPIAGTEIAVEPNGYGRMAKPVRVLMLVANDGFSREAGDVFEGTGAKVDVLLATGADQDIYSTDGDKAAITKRLEKGEYDLYMIPRGGPKRVGKELAQKIIANVKKGAGLYLTENKDYNRFASVAKTGAVGKGRVFVAETKGKYQGYLPEDDLSEYGKSFFPRRRFMYPQVVADAVRTAFGERADVTGAKTRREEFIYAGRRHEAVWTLDEKGRTLDWCTSSAPVADARLGSFEDDGEKSTLVLEGDVAGCTLRWEFSDFSGRVLARGEVAAKASVELQFPREKLYTNYGGVRLELVKDGVTVDQRGECVFAARNDRERLFGDFSPSVWPGTAPLDDVPAMNRQLQNIGIRSSIIPSRGTPAFEQFLSTGLAVGGNWLGDGWMYTGKPQKNNVRFPNFNAKEWRSTKKEQVRRTTSATARFGLFQNVLCDEPQLVREGRADEVDAHPENLAEYRLRMEKKYGTIGEYNRRHCTSHKSFADLNQTLQADARASGNPAEFIEWRNFNVDRWCEAIRLVADGAKEGDADAPFSICNSFGQSALSGNDYWKLLTRTGIGISQEYTAMVYFGRNANYNFDEFYRSFRPDMRVWGWTGYFYTAERAKFMPWWFAAHRYGGFSWYAATFSGYNIIDPETFALTVDGRDLKASLEDSRLLDGLGKALLEYDWVKRDIAIYYSHDSMLLATIRGPETKNGEIAQSSPLHDFMYSRQGAQYLIEDLLFQHDFVAPEQIAGGKLAAYKVLFMPRINAMSDAEVGAVKAFLASGGRIIADELPGGCDELGVKRAANPFDGLNGITVTGRNFDDCDAVQRESTLEALKKAGVGAIVKSPTIVKTFGREAMRFTDGINSVYMILRHPGRSQDKSKETFEFAESGFVYDLRARKFVGRTDKVTTKIPFAGAAVYSVLPYKVSSVEIKAEKRMDAIAVELSLDAGGSKVGTHVYNVKFVSPSGKCDFHFRRNVTAPQGRAALVFPMALNDERGVWRIVAEDALSGVTAEVAVAIIEK